ncbi:hypothetical protein JKF63_02800 [Porcisia hertigi]|uniref:Uncharacterized protein n=1 Tax=Porcisia hertigi TaxID=2761500 RepID=A0A836L4Z6_9TRYP|nr:hypothetical protein JKF63_02800 [Porcisia hertigi]
MPPRQAKRHDPDVWKPPPPLPTSSTQTSTSTPGAGGGVAPAPSHLSAFQERFAKRTEVVGKDGANAQLGVAAVSSSSHCAPSPAQPKGGGIATLRAPRKNISEGATSAAPSSLAAPEHRVTAPIKRVLKNAPRLRILAPIERGRTLSSSLPSEDPRASSPTVALQRGARLSCSSLATAPAETKKAVKHILAPPAAAAAAPAAAPTAALYRAATEHRSAEKPSCSILSLGDGTDLRPQPSTASPSLGTPLALPHMHSPGKATVVSSTPPPVLTSLRKNEPLPVPRSDRLTEPPRSRERPAPTTAVATPPPGRPKHPEQRKASSHPVTRLNAERCRASSPPSPPPSGPAAADSSTPSANYKPYSLRSYKALMADVAGQKMGGLGPSDTDEQRAAREKHERAKAYGRRAESVARTLLAGAALRGDKETGNPDATIISPVSSSSVDADRRQGRPSARSSSSDTRTSDTTTTTTSTTTSRSPSAKCPPHRRQTPRTAARAALLPPPQASSPPPAQSRLSGAATPQPQFSAPAFDSGELTPLPLGVESTNAKPLQALLPPLSAPPRTSPAVGSFSVGAAPRRQVAQARRRRERALTYARGVSQRRLQPTPAGSDDGDSAHTESRGSVSPGGRVVKNGAAGDANAHGVPLARQVCVPSSGILRQAAADDADRAQRQRRLLELEALHAQKKEVVEVIRRKLRV